MGFLIIGFFFFSFSFSFHKFRKSGKTMNAPLLQCILIALVGAELAFSHGSKSLAEDKAGEMSDKIKAVSHRRSLLHRLAGHQHHHQSGWMAGHHHQTGWMISLLR